MTNSKPITPLPVRTTGEVPRRVQRLCRGVLRLFGWRLDRWAVPDDVKKILVIGEHHTSNLDSILMIIMVAAMGRRLNWLVKHELNQPIIGSLIRATGGIFVNRHHPSGTVGHVIEIFNARDEMFLVLAPSATRSKTDRWRTGFYYMANGADVPVGLGYLDYVQKCAGIGEVIRLSGDIALDEAHFQAFYQHITARYPQKASDVRLVPPLQIPPSDARTPK